MFRDHMPVKQIQKKQKRNGKKGNISSRFDQEVRRGHR